MHQLTTAAVVGTGFHKKLLTWVMFLVQMVLMDMSAGTRAATHDIADEVTTPFRVWSVSVYLCALQVRLLDYRVDTAAVAL